MRVEHQLRAFDQILSQYDGNLPFHRFLPGYFKQHKQMGSSDRRWASRYCYSYFRMGEALSARKREVRLAIADFLCHQTTSLVIENYLPSFVPAITLSLPEKIALVEEAYSDFVLAEVFSWNKALVSTINQHTFDLSFFMQPQLFIHVKAKDMSAVKTQLLAKDILVRKMDGNILALPNGTKLQEIVNDANKYRVQDLSSQKTAAYFLPQPADYWWDCCAASGGKSLLLHDLEPHIELLVSDVRENSLHNLTERFEQAGIRKYQKKVIDLLEDNEQILHHYAFDGILLDAPCTGSGTWGRTPEMLCHFDSKKIVHYTKLQKAFAAQVVKYLKPGKPLIYITCSVFSAENDEVVEYMMKELGLKLEKMELIEGYKEQADSMFVARLIKP